MGGGLAGPELAVAVAGAGALGTLGLAPPRELVESIRQVRDGAPGRFVLPHRSDRRDAGFGGRPHRVLRGTDRPADYLAHIGPAGGDRLGAGQRGWTMK